MFYEVVKTDEFLRSNLSPVKKVFLRFIPLLPKIYANNNNATASLKELAWQLLLYGTHVAGT